MPDTEDMQNAITELEARIDQLENRQPELRIMYADNDEQARHLVEKIVRSRSGECIKCSKTEMKILSDPYRMFVLRTD